MFGLCVAAIGVYVWYDPFTVYFKFYGGIWFGYTFGIVGAVLILWLMLFGVRKRRYCSSIGSVQGWTSVYVYFGVSLIIIAMLYSAFEFGWNVYTFVYVLMLVVIVSGFFGVYVYLYYSELMISNFVGETLETMLFKVADLDRKCKRIALDLPDEFNEIVMNAFKGAAQKTALDGSLRCQLVGVEVNHPVRVACDAFMKMETKNLISEQVKIQE